ncbi:MAG: Asp-tRNA(Asn)/Glu-tRNA(Gln) amidotransferase subunit GatA [Verrucomicrobiota bacterium]|nr:Asp-tRNA(Asn)/Glu-tRNA(Gln) amidotransferase subunit GatA [Verrucomicrobiota bacterium]
MSLTFEPIHVLRKKLVSGELSPVDLAQETLQRFREVEPRINSFVELNEKKVLSQAEATDIHSGPLAGIPITLKDNINVTGESCGCSSKILKGYVAPYDATVTTHLKRAGAVLFGRANMDEFAMGSSTENSSVKVTRNPWNLETIPGGSSGGSAASVSAGQTIAALGSDTGGSIRQPAALCGVVGTKPTYGRVSRYGLVAFASSLDQIGPITRDVRDAALLTSVLSGLDSMDATSLDLPVPDFMANLEGGVKELRIGLPKQYFIKGIHPEVEAAVQKAIKTLESLGASVVEVDLPHTEYAVATYYIIATAEASANLARFDGVRYGHRTEKDVNIIDMYGETREEGFGTEVKRRIILGTYVLSSGYYDAYYLRAQKVRTLIRQDFTNAFNKCDVILTPTSPTPAFKIGERTADPLAMYLADIFTIAVNLAGTCGISIPCGMTSDNLPIGLQLIGKPFDEATMFRAAYTYEQATDWHKARPKL